MADQNNYMPNPLTHTDLQTLNNVLQSCSICEDITARCRRSGINVEQLSEVNRNNQMLATGIKREFFPGEM
jgi:hypothetical protein